MNHRLKKVLIYGCVGLVLAIVFAGYFQPSLMADIANNLWALCGG
jgi:hypothetical protein